MPTPTPGALKSSFPAIVDAATRVLVLGSLPGEVSLLRREYYGHPQNQFWRLMGEVTGRELIGLAYPERLDALLAAGVGLWDVIKSAERVGSLDAHIRSHSPNPLAAFVVGLPALRAIGFNGAKAAAIGARQLADLAKGPQLIFLPSSSPAHAIGFERKRTEWMKLKPFLEG